MATQYSPFFYDSYASYYGNSNDDSNRRYNEEIVKEWSAYLNGKIVKKDLEILLFKSTDGGLDSVYKYANGKLSTSPLHLPDLKSSGLSKNQLNIFLPYLLLAKKSESFTINDAWSGWDEKVKIKVPAVALRAELLNAFQNSKDDFIKERLWFQLVRYSYFEELQSEAGTLNDKGDLMTFFNKYESSFPKNVIYYRTLGYVAGHYYKQKDYAKANYLYSLCYNFSADMKIPSKWSFHPQNESDWQKSLAMAKNNEEKCTLWQMLGISNDGPRAIEKIYEIDPRSEKMELLLSRLINISEMPSYGYEKDSSGTAEKKALVHDTELVSNIARKNNTAKPYFWNLAAGYMNTLSGDYSVSRSFYNKAKTQLPKNNKLVEAQYRILDWTLYLSQLKKIDAKTESEMTGTMNWLADLRDQKDTVQSLRYGRALSHSITLLSDLYKKQGDLLKSNCFSTQTEFYASNANIEALKALLGKTNKTPFEQAMLRYFPLKIEDLYYHQGLMMVYQDKTDQAIALMEKSGTRAQYKLLANPFSIRLNDCHDCDFDAVQKVKYTPISFLKAVKTLKSDIIAGKNAYVNTFLLADAYYNITHYGNARTFYQSAITGSDATSPMDIPVEFRQTLTSGKIAEKYYLLARTYAKTREQKTRCTFMAAKCERNDIYNAVYNNKANAGKFYWDFDFRGVPVGKYFAELKTQYYQTQYYNEILKECGYFKSYVNKH